LEFFVGSLEKICMRSKIGVFDGVKNVAGGAKICMGVVKMYMGLKLKVF